MHTHIHGHAYTVHMHVHILYTHACTLTHTHTHDHRMQRKVSLPVNHTDICVQKQTILMLTVTETYYNTILNNAHQL